MIIAITGKKGSGKDYAGSILSAYLGIPTRAFVDPCTNKIKEMFDLNTEEYDLFKRSEHNFMNKTVHGREIVRGIGMAMRDVNPNFTIDYMSQFDECIITDLRFQDEYDWCRLNNAIIIKVVSETDINDSDKHISEQGFDDEMCSFVVYNNKDHHFKTQLINKLGKFL